MTIIPIESSNMLQSVAMPVASQSPSAPVGMFDKLCAQLEGLNGQLINAEQSVGKLANGQTENLHQVMIQLEQTKMAFDLMLQVRNKVMDAYQEVMRMQV